MKSSEEKLKATASRLGIGVEQIPRHIAIIMDGNGRWAERQGLARAEGHAQGGKTVEEIAQCCVDFGIQSLTLYSFSIENWKRPEREVNALMHLYEEYLVIIRPMLMNNSVRLVHLGETAGLPQGVCDELAATIEMTGTNTGLVLALALNYGGRAEIISAARNIAREHKEGKLSLADIDEQCISDHLYAPGLSDPDLLIRTANEMRISNFLLWQISYSEFYVTDTLWPDFRRAAMEEAILDYSKRVRRFGAVVKTAEE